MKKAVSLIVTVAAVISLSACAGRENEKLSGVMDSIAGSEPIENLADGSDTETVTTNEEAQKPSDEILNNGDIETDGMEHSRILIAYFTWAENTYVENSEAVDVDATTSASVLPPGNAAKMAAWIQESADEKKSIAAHAGTELETDQPEEQFFMEIFAIRMNWCHLV